MLTTVIKRPPYSKMMLRATDLNWGPGREDRRLFFNMWNIVTYYPKCTPVWCGNKEADCLVNIQHKRKDPANCLFWFHLSLKSTKKGLDDAFTDWLTFPIVQKKKHVMAWALIVFVPLSSFHSHSFMFLHWTKRNVCFLSKVVFSVNRTVFLLF